MSCGAKINDNSSIQSQVPVCDYIVNKKCAVTYKSERGRGMESLEVFINVQVSEAI